MKDIQVMMYPALVLVATALVALGVFVLLAQRKSPVNRWFAICAVSLAGWTIGTAGANFGILADVSLRLGFAGASIAPPAFLAFVRAYPVPSVWPSSLLLRIVCLIGGALALVSLATNLVAYQPSLSSAGFARKTGILYLPFAMYCLSTLCSALVLLVAKWYSATGLTSLQLQYLGLGSLVATVGGLTTNLLIPSITSDSRYTWIGPFFLLPFVLLVAHAIIRHRLMGLRLVLRRGLTVGIATLMSLCPVGVLVILFWPRFISELEAIELVVLLVAITLTTLLVPPTRDIAGAFIDRYAYRTHANFQKTVLQASRQFTRHLDLHALLSLVTEAIASSIESEGVTIYLRSTSNHTKVKTETRHRSATVAAPDIAPELITRALASRKDLIVRDELAREAHSESKRLQAELAQLNWALVLPLLSEDTVIGFIALGPKLSGDPFYAQDLDLLMTLAHQAGIAIKNAQLYTQVVLANEYIENIVRTMESGVVAVDGAGQVAMFNRAAELLTGRPAPQVRHHPVDVLPPGLGALLKSTLADGRERTEPEIALPDGAATRPVICTTSPLRDPGGAVLGAVAVFSDLTPFKQLESERRRAERLAYFEILASSLAHEIRNPLVAIKAFAQLMPLRHRDERFVDEFSRRVARETDRMEGLVERLRALSRPSDRPKQPLDVREPIRQAVASLRPLFEEKGVALDLALGDAPCTIMGDEHELEQLFINLATNAHEATPPGGVVSISLTHTTADVTVSVADSGPGIPPELLEHIFDPFITTKPRGSGLGLSICAGIAAAHRAKLLATNRPGGGALFTMEVPLVTPAAPAKEVRGTEMNARA